MSTVPRVRVVTNDFGERKYFIERATPPRNMFSLTTILGCAPSKALIYHAGVQGVNRTIDVCADLDFFDSEDQREVIEAACAKAFGRTKEGFIKPPHLLEWEKKADTGSAVHNAIERVVKIILGLPAPEPYDQTAFTAAQSIATSKAFDSWAEWREKSNFTPLASEEVVWQEGYQDMEPGSLGKSTIFHPMYDYACRIDLAAEIMGVRGIFDVKTGKMDTNGQPYPSMWLQVEAQRRAANARNLCGGGFEVAGIIHVPAAGGPVVVHSNALRDRDRDFQAFDHLNGYARLSVLGDPNEGG